jgi:hypothetical protein
VRPSSLRWCVMPGLLLPLPLPATQPPNRPRHHRSSISIKCSHQRVRCLPQHDTARRHGSVCTTAPGGNAPPSCQALCAPLCPLPPCLLPALPCDALHCINTMMSTRGGQRRRYTMEAAPPQPRTPVVHAAPDRTQGGPKRELPRGRRCPALAAPAVQGLHAQLD